MNKCVDDSKLEVRLDFKFSNGATYKGQWLGQDIRHGFGVQIWPDGARYIGMWKENKAHGQGQFIHVDGDKYDGNWFEDQAHGYGNYYHADGSSYKGEWEFD